LKYSVEVIHTKRPVTGLSKRKQECNLTHQHQLTYSIRSKALAQLATLPSPVMLVPAFRAMKFQYDSQ